MIHAFWSLKGGVGATTTATATAVLRARAGHKVLLVDTQGDLPHAVGLADAEPKGMAEWLSSSSSASLSQFEYPAASDLHLLPLGFSPLEPDPAKLAQLVEQLAQDPRDVIVDCGCLWRHELFNSDFPAEPSGQFKLAHSLLAGAQSSLLVVRSCFLGLRRLDYSPWQPSAAILILEAGRALGHKEVATLAKCTVATQLELDVRVGRAVDAGLLASELPSDYGHALANLQL